MKPDTPIAWLWSQLDTLLSEPTLDLLRKNYAAHKHAYERAAKIRKLQRSLAELERWSRTKRNAAMIEKMKARIKALEDEETVIDDVS